MSPVLSCLMEASPSLSSPLPRYQVYPTCRNTSGVLGFSITVETQATKYR